MNYKEKYEKALERAKVEQEIFFNLGSISAKTAIERIFPELRESEDERIRKEIIQSIQDNMCVIHKDKCLVWLEKQGEQKSLNCKVDLSNCSEEYRKAYYDGWNNCNLQHEREKQKWSEEDENKLEEAIGMVEANGTWVRSEDAVNLYSLWTFNIFNGNCVISWDDNKIPKFKTYEEAVEAALLYTLKNLI